ncbi:hypothetical protein KFZ70_08030 [Tamlana fucoidanivorans]|uniref:PorT family protein n=1 Tax=Allotamlana fucoidanivorans TaxID=2583814 RepID=A0A5C4SJ08_9FLAO|nr:hypothetical protein [Tamlana fucoidanivorans]TNJ43728.1 hypothetical protein FGF67_10165 [Tamlana fucoidanivorans]
MQTLLKYGVLLVVCLITHLINAQDTIQNTNNQYKIEAYKQAKLDVKTEERQFLKAEVQAINTRLEQGEITEEQANQLKKEASKKRALNIENRIAIIDNKIALLERNEKDYLHKDITDVSNIEIEVSNDDDEFLWIKIKDKKKPKKYDKRTQSDLVFAMGFNNALIEGEKLDDTPYKIGGSGFIELGFAWKTRLLEHSNFFRFKYGASIQWNKLNIRDNMYFVNTDGAINLEEFPYPVRVSKFRVTNFVFPLHLEIGPSKRIDKDTYFRYSTKKQFKFGVGGYAGFNIGTLQKVKYQNENGKKVKDKARSGFNTSELIYGVSSYIALGTTALYVKYDLNPIFRNQAISQNNISVGLRFDMD